MTKGRWADHQHVAKFIPIENGTVVEMGDTGVPGVSGRHHLVGFKPAPGRKVGGWLVVMVHVGESMQPRVVRNPAKQAVRKGAVRKVAE